MSYKTLVLAVIIYTFMSENKIVARLNLYGNYGYLKSYIINPVYWEI